MTTENDILDKIQSTNWEEYNGPEYYNYKEVVPTLIGLTKVYTDEQNKQTYNNVLFTIGNNHAGSYYPAILKALPIIIKIAETTNNEIVRNCALNIIDDLYCCFGPESGSYNKISTEEIENFVKYTIRNFIEENKLTDSDRNTQLIADLIEFIKNENAST